MSTLVEKKLEIWKKKLLDLGMRNRLLNYKDSKRGSLNITAPSYQELFQKLVVEEKVLILPYYRIEEVEVTVPTPQQKETKVKKQQVVTVPGDVTTDRDGKESHLTAKNLRDKAKTVQEEQGVNVLYLAFGFLDWKDEIQGKDQLLSPLVLVPVTLKQGIITDPYRLSIHEDEIVVNPTLIYKLENDYKLPLPEYDAQNEEIESYLTRVRELVAPLGWKVTEQTSLSLLSFTKINMYKDLQEHGSRMSEHPLIQGLCGEASSETMNQMDFSQMEGWSHDNQDPESVFQVVDADSSQQDAIYMSQQGASFVLQGPPGTGKSQTITNMIAQALGEGKKVLFVSEKMAALEVVYNRLSAAGLADFCLVLHSNKANKRDFLDSLRKVTELKPIAVKESALYKLRELEDRRQKLNDYCKQLHEVVEPMHQSVYDANSIIANLEAAPDMIFSLEGVELRKLTQGELHQLRMLVNELGKSRKKLTEDYEVNTWRNTTITQINHEIRHDLSALFADTKEVVSVYEEARPGQEEALGLSLTLSYEQLAPMADLLEYCITIPTSDMNGNTTLSHEENGMPVLLFLGKEVETLQEMKEQSFTLESIWKEALALKKELSTDYEDALFGLNARKLLDQISSSLKQTGTEGATLVGKESLYAFLSLYSADIRAEDFWLTPRWHNPEARKQWFDTGVAGVLKVAKAREVVLKDYEKDILSIDYKSMLTRFKTDYTSFFKFFNGQYKQDCNTLRALRKVPVKKLSNEEILQILNQLKDYHDALDELKANETELKQYLGGWYQGEWTEFEPITRAWDSWLQLQELYNGNFPEAVKEDLLSGMNTSRYTKELLYLKNQLSADNKLQADDISASTKEGNTSLDALKNALTLVSGWEDSLKPVKELSRSSADCNTSCYDGLLKLEAYERFYHTLLEFQNQLQAFYGPLYQSEATDWELVRGLLDWNIEYQNKAKGLVSHEDAAQAMKQPGYDMHFTQTAQWLRGYIDNYENILSQFCGLYQERVGLAGFQLPVLSDWANRCQNNLEGLEDWLDFMQVLERCEAEGLKQFTDRALAQQLTTEQMGEVFLKRVQRLWLDAVMPELPAVDRFRTRSHEEIIKEFGRLDLEQMKIAQSRIRERLIRSLPNMNSFTSARDEVGILNHEMGKQRKIMPVRKLFNSIPNLLPRLKPCMMMSPLSVSQFLESEAYMFDLVIFDEASQVKTENAIGAISRGKQAIIAGDMHQLPPTNFFNTTLSGQDDYDGEEEDDSEAFESVLDESGTVMPQLTLKWHYRSKNESLITFSNRKIYNNSLVTFPSPTSSHELEGVEYIYVPEGIYQRSSSRNNPVEAERVADEVFDMIRIQPNRSMGVITFSEAQQRCVESAIINRRLANPEYEWYFSEGKEEPFFIKNLENVQGDERDIILFSIGYGKASPTEEMHMNFGPLNQAGGYRRLNVAITRAKYTIKLIGSILPSDMRISEDSPKGVRMLRDYIAYAQNGVEALEDITTALELTHHEASFENAICQFLTQKGYQIATHVGCSGYRIDIAVKHPENPERYILGIECDGDAYHSSRTARERDRLRHSVLKAMGWSFYRIWSTDWIKDPTTVGSHLIAAIEDILRKEEEAQAMEAAAEAMEEEAEEESVPEASAEEESANENPASIASTEDESANDISSTEDSDTEVYEFTFEEESYEMILEEEPVDRSLPDADESGNRWGFSTFQPKSFAKMTTDYPISAIADSVDTIVQTQAPIHLYLVCKQIAPLFGSSKVTQKVKNGVQTLLKTYQERRGWELKGDYLWLAHQQEITPKVPDGDQVYREIKYIAPEELAAAMEVILNQSIGLPKEDLFHLVAKEYGYARTTSAMAEYLETAYSLLIDSFKS